ncbi:MAG: hypothetical protein HDS79_07390 [Bacteroidales bacterium]|nr:hypothetical protein [Bacteroidales bacterium]
MSFIGKALVGAFDNRTLGDKERLETSFALTGDIAGEGLNPFQGLHETSFALPGGYRWRGPQSLSGLARNELRADGDFCDRMIGINGGVNEGDLNEKEFMSKFVIGLKGSGKKGGAVLLQGEGIDSEY